MFSIRWLKTVVLRNSKRRMMTTLETLNFDNLALRCLPIDPIKENYVRKVSGSCFSLVKPAKIENPQVVATSEDAMKLVDLTLSEINRQEFASYFSGNQLLPGSETAAHCYCGHQFGYFSGQLGDGAAMYLGEIINNKGERWEVQLKGAGPTPYSRQADGRKVLRSSIREFLCSEAMYHLGIPTTRAGTCITSDTTVTRDIFYDGHPIEERCTVVLRIAQTFLRFGSFEICKTLDPMTGRVGPSVGQHDILEKLLKYTVSTFYPEINELHSNDDAAKYREFYAEVVRRTARLVADWQCVGFCHGVLNTDNMSVAGVTMDYGPYGFMDRFNPDFICNASDDGGRYSYINQPNICVWNLKKFAEALEPVLNLDVSLSVLQETFHVEFNHHYLTKMRRKFGLLRAELQEDKELIESFMETMTETGADFTNCFRGLARLTTPSCARFSDSLSDIKSNLLEHSSSLLELQKTFQPHMDDTQMRILQLLMSQNPGILEALGKKQPAIEKELKRREKYTELKKLTDDEKKRSDGALWDSWLNKYVDRLRKEEVPVDDSEVVNVEEINEKRIEVMNSTNPRVVLRNYIAQAAIEEAEKGNYEEVKRVLKVLRNPFADGDEVDTLSDAAASKLDEGFSSGACAASKFTPYDCRPPSWALNLRVT